MKRHEKRARRLAARAWGVPVDIVGTLGPRTNDRRVCVEAAPDIAVAGSWRALRRMLRAQGRARSMR